MQRALAVLLFLLLLALAVTAARAPARARSKRTDTGTAATAALLTGWLSAFVLVLVFDQRHPDLVGLPAFRFLGIAGDEHAVLGDQDLLAPFFHPIHRDGAGTGIFMLLLLAALLPAAAARARGRRSHRRALPAAPALLVGFVAGILAEIHQPMAPVIDADNDRMRSRAIEIHDDGFGRVALR